MLRNTGAGKGKEIPRSVSSASTPRPGNRLSDPFQGIRLDPAMRLVVGLVIFPLLVGSFVVVLSAPDVARSSPYNQNDSVEARQVSGGMVPMHKASGLRMARAPEAHQMKLAADTSNVEEAEEMDMEEMSGGDVTDSGHTLGSDLLANMEKSLNGRKEDPVITDRMLAHSGDISLMSPEGKADDLADKITDLVNGAGKGFVESRSSSRSSSNGYNPSWSGGKGRKSIHMQIRVASAEFHAILAHIQNLAGKERVISVSTNSRDVTDEFIDSKARADTLAASRDALKALLSSANSIKDVISVKNELNRLTEQIESHKRRAMFLQKQASLSSLSVHIEEEEISKDSTKKLPSPMWDPSKPMYLASRHVAYLLSFAGNTIVYAAVWAMPCAILVLLAKVCGKNSAKPAN